MRTIKQPTAVTCPACDVENEEGLFNVRPHPLAAISKWVCSVCLIQYCLTDKGNAVITAVRVVDLAD